MVQSTTDDQTLEAIFNLKRKLEEPEDASDSDESSIGEAPTNRGKKLKRHARFVHRGRLVGEYGLMVDGAIVDYGGKLRTVIDQNPKRRRKTHHEEDDEEEAEDEDPERELVDDEWPYSQVNLKELLIPLSHPSELVTHPALSRIFKSNKIRVLAEQALESIRAEQAHMTKLRRLLSVLLGDENIFAEQDDISPQAVSIQPPEDTDSDKDVDIMDVDETSKDPEPEASTNPNGQDHKHDTNGVQTNGTAEPITGAPENQEPTESTIQPADQPNPPAENQPTNGTAHASTNVTPSRSPSPTIATRPTTRLQTAAANPRPRTSDNPFQWPSALVQSIPTTTPDDFGISILEASEVRRMVQAALERSQEFIRCLEKVRLALVRADKQRKTVWLWCKDSAKLVAEQDAEEQ